MFDYLCTRIFFLPNLSMKISQKFLTRNTVTIYKIQYSHSTPKGTPACAMTSKSYDRDLRNLAKISQKMNK